MNINELVEAYYAVARSLRHQALTHQAMAENLERMADNMCEQMSADHAKAAEQPKAASRE